MLHMLIFAWEYFFVTCFSLQLISKLGIYGLSPTVQHDSEYGHMSILHVVYLLRSSL